ncbi:Acrylyl-CoA reductase AcuI [Corynebacterium provencense]|uniref:Acrylyl-CoA reductase AcuI n=1 Tax=Corynebacterium provencense TaxID=1737425 RepID=A0A2Z3YNT1_9CORY|nr:MDR family oxidoreductase [Corynebacterium provencense]AWT24931.1 Acrylyl-CoA reductase AcuI [Corynebacterium provencense]
MRAIIARQQGQPASLEEVDESTLLTGDVGIDVDYSSLNYKDGTALSGTGIVQAWPLVLGIDVVGTVTDSASPRFAPGDRVVLNGARIGESLHGGFAEKARVAADSLIRIPEPISPLRAAAIGTAGFTAALAVLALEDAGVQPGDGEVLVTGAAGGTGSVTIRLLAARGYTVVASTGRAEEQGDYLRTLGAARLIDRNQVSTELGKPLQSQLWAAAVDAVGSTTLANILAQTNYGGTVVSYGLVQGLDLPTTVLHFILRAVTLTGANSVDAPLALRERAWALLAETLDLPALDGLTETIGLGDVLAAGEQIQQGEIRGRVVIDVNR